MYETSECGGDRSVGCQSREARAKGEGRGASEDVLMDEVVKIPGSLLLYFGAVKAEGGSSNGPGGRKVRIWYDRCRSQRSGLRI